MTTSQSLVQGTRQLVLAAAAFATLALGVSWLQPHLAKEIHDIKDRDDVYPFPPPAALRIATLGYVAATVDVLWGKLLVENGSHWAEHRHFGDLEHYLDAIITLDPTYRPFYEYVDSLLCYRPMNGHEPDARKAREYLEAGTRLMPNDPEIWLKYGQFVAFMGVSYLSSESEKETWRREGGIAINHAVELGADVDRGIAASVMLNKRFGEKEAAIRFYERAYAVTDDEAARADIAARLELLHADRARDCTRGAMATVESRWRAEYPFLDRGTYMLIGPSTNPMRCVGAGAATEPGCERDWARIISPQRCE